MSVVLESRARGSKSKKPLLSSYRCFLLIDLMKVPMVSIQERYGSALPGGAAAAASRTRRNFPKPYGGIVLDAIPVNAFAVQHGPNVFLKFSDDLRIGKKLPEIALLSTTNIPLCRPVRSSRSRPPE